jgi:hypothetical protein
VICLASGQELLESHRKPQATAQPTKHICLCTFSFVTSGSRHLCQMWMWCGQPAVELTMLPGPGIILSLSDYFKAQVGQFKPCMQCCLTPWT